MNAKTRKLRLPLIAILLILGLMAIVLPQSIITFAAGNDESYIHEVNGGYEYTEHDCGHDHSQVEYDLLEGYTGPGYNVEEIYLQQLGLIQPMNATVPMLTLVIQLHFRMEMVDKMVLQLTFCRLDVAIGVVIRIHTVSQTFRFLSTLQECQPLL